MTRSSPGRHVAAAGQKGLALFVALIVLVAMSLAGIALVRSVDTATLIAGNIAFRQSATTSGDAGVEAARAWLIANNGSTLQDDRSGDGYYATSQDALDLTGNRTPGDTADDVGWDGAGAVAPKCLVADNAGNTSCYVIHRLCNTAGPLSGATCSTQQAAKGGSSLGAMRPMTTDQERSWSDAATLAYYRVTVRIAGPRNNTSFIQAFILI
ncbi:MAG: hypothetical protein OHM77_12935 [Candidatus Nitricoxidivorans perseverans]|uniref:Type 4 fimbrial biogenesis protein PilX N-terminal domain-containing protein n=1 Tax=Candidatus Nitricoxidivorans perseverans TaxID=2975601 RepID=A0AA49IWK3_9PROT|nr:MAG: hypothetical protein OHM77_12935 [Candidatus Nitricoxidivorans perseverans]